MKKKSVVSLGPGAASLVLIFVALAMSALGMLSLMNSRSDLKLSERSVQVAQAVYQLQTAAEERRAALDALLFQAAQSAADEDAYREAVAAALPEEIEWADGELRWEETDGVRTLSCALRLLPLGEGERAQWSRFELTAVTEEAW